MFFETPKTLLLLHRDHIDVFSSGAEQPQQFPLDVSYFQYLELIDRPAFVQHLTDFLLTLPALETVVIVVAPDLCFVLSLTKEQVVQPDSAFQPVIDSLPIDPLKTVMLKVDQGEQGSLIVTNGDFLEQVTLAISAAKGKIIAVTSSALWPNVEMPLTTTAVKKMLSDKALIEAHDFLKHRYVVQTPSSINMTNSTASEGIVSQSTMSQLATPSQPSKNRVWILVLIFVLLIAVLLFVLMQNGFFNIAP